MGSKLKITTGFRREILSRPWEFQAKWLYNTSPREVAHPSSPSVKTMIELKARWIVTARVVTRAAFEGAEAVWTGGVTGRKDVLRGHAPAPTAGSAHHRLSPLHRGEEKH